MKTEEEIKEIVKMPSMANNLKLFRIETLEQLNGFIKALLWVLEEK